MASSRQCPQTIENLEFLVLELQRKLQQETQKRKDQVNDLQEQIFALTEKLQAKQLPEKTSEKLTPDEPKTLQDILWEGIMERVDIEVEKDSLIKHRREGDISTSELMRREDSLKHKIPISYSDLLTKLKESPDMKPAVPYTQSELDERFKGKYSIANYHDAEKCLDFYNESFFGRISLIVSHEADKFEKYNNGICCKNTQKNICFYYDRTISDFEVIRRLEAYISQEKDK